MNRGQLFMNNRFGGDKTLGIGGPRWARYYLYLLMFVAVFGDFIANDKPIYCRLDGQIYWPVLQQYAVDWGWTTLPAKLANADWHALDYQQKIMPPIPYQASTIDRKNMGYRGPFDRQQVESLRYRHWLGTDQLGRDTLAGLIRGARTALLVGLVAMGVAGFIGILLGGLAGYFGDNRLRLSGWELGGLIIGVILGLYYGFLARQHALTSGNLILQVTISLMLLATLTYAGWRAGRLIAHRRGALRRFRFPVDSLISRSIELLNSIPDLLLILSVLAIIRKPNILYVMLIIGLINWTGMARLVRAELLRIRELPYIDAARTMGFSDLQIWWKHALPNSLRPVGIALAFGIAGAVLTEAFISFLGIGLAPEAVSWGSMLNQVQSKVSAWWLALFPGLAIFMTVMAFNIIGEHWNDRLMGKNSGTGVQEPDQQLTEEPG